MTATSVSLVLEWAKILVPALITVVFAGWATRISQSQRDIAKGQKDIARAQKAVAHAKLNLDLFDRRFEMFQVTWGFLSAGVNSSEHELIHSDFTNQIPRARFLFGAEIADYMLEASNRRGRLSLLNRTLEARPNHPEFTKLTQETTELHSWFFEEASKGCYKRFAEYLDFSAWKVDPIERFFNLNSAANVPTVWEESLTTSPSN